MDYFISVFLFPYDNVWARNSLIFLHLHLHCLKNLESHKLVMELKSFAHSPVLDKSQFDVYQCVCTRSEDI